MRERDDGRARTLHRVLELPLLERVALRARDRASAFDEFRPAGGELHQVASVPPGRNSWAAAHVLARSLDPREVLADAGEPERPRRGQRFELRGTEPLVADRMEALRPGERQEEERPGQRIAAASLPPHEAARDEEKDDDLEEREEPPGELDQRERGDRGVHRGRRRYLQEREE